MSDYRYTPNLEPMIESSPGVYEQARYRFTCIGDVKAGDTVWVSERQADGTWGPQRPVLVVDTPTIPAGTTDHEQQETT